MASRLAKRSKRTERSTRTRDHDGGAMRVRRSTVKVRGNTIVARCANNAGSALEDRAWRILAGEKAEAGGLIARLRKGLPFSCLERVLKRTGDAELVLHVIGMTSRTFFKRKKTRAFLDPVTSDRLYRLVKVEVRAIEIFGDEEAAIDWLKVHNRALGDKPLSLLDTGAGADRVLRVLGRIEHGVYA